MGFMKPFFACMALFGSCFTLTAACSTGAVAVDECRDIQYARCEAALLCGFAEVSSFDDVDECKRFYRDQCLHGIQNSKAPSKQEHAVCTDLLDSAISCAENDIISNLGEEGVTLIGESGSNIERPDPEDFTKADDCSGVDTTLAPGVPVSDPADLSVCDVLKAPFYLFDCSYVSTPPTSDAMGGSSGE